MSRRGNSVLARMESSYLEDEPLDGLVDRLHELLSLEADGPAWSSYSIAVRGRVLADAMRDGCRDTSTRQLGLLHLVLLVAKSERHLSNNHRTTIEMAKARLSRELGFARVSRRAANAFIAHAARAMGPDGFPHEGSISHARGLASELLLAEESGFGDPTLTRSIEAAISSVAFSDGTAPCFGDSFPERGIAPVAPAPRWNRTGRIVLARSGPFELAISLGSQGPRVFGGHGHLDRGSFELFHRDAGLLVADPGCTLYGSSVTRTFERSYLAHNMATPRWGLADQPIWGSFAYRRMKHSDFQQIDAQHNRLRVVMHVDHETRSGSDAVQLVRTLELDDQGLTVADTVSGRSSHRPVVRTFLAAESARVTANGSTSIRPVNGGTRFALSLRSDSQWRQIREELNPHGGASGRVFSARIELARSPPLRPTESQVSAVHNSYSRFSR